MKVWKQKDTDVVVRWLRSILLPFGDTRNKLNLIVEWSFCLLVFMSLPCAAFASGLSSSTDYSVGEAFFGSGGQLNACSANFCSKTTAGELAVGAADSAHYEAHAGFNTDRQPYIQIDVNSTNINLGKLSTTATTTATATFSVEAYLSHGYTVTNGSPGPSYDGYTMDSPSSATASAIGTEQFGMNLVANTFPSTFGANPVQAPDGTFSYGEPTYAYDTANAYRYVEGDTIAESTSSSSFTIYTISYIFNISNITPGGTYTFNHVLVATGDY
jgi:hypothetical protein